MRTIKTYTEQEVKEIRSQYLERIAQQDTLKDFADLIRDKIIFSKRWLLSGFAALVVIALGVGYANHIENIGLQASITDGKTIVLDVDDIIKDILNGNTNTN